MGVKAVTQGNFQVMDNIIYVGHTLREVIVEKRTLYQIAAGNWKV